jgi:phage terminase large subunit-like protein
VADPPKKVPSEWIRNAADELAVARGCRFDIERGEHFIKTVEKNYRLYEGAKAGQLVELMPFQRDFFMRLFSWVVYSEFRGRWIRRFKRARWWIPKKNGKSPSAAMAGLYLTTADGEMGGKTYSAAKDGKQAQIVHDHAIKMVEQSEALMDLCDINRTSRRITHVPSQSWYGVLASDNIEGQEGLNGNAIIDEGHVVDDRLARVLKFMGVSREEPIELMVSTAGDTLDGWGKREWDYGQRVNSGETKDIGYLHECYAAAQDATDEDLLKPETWFATNPALGHILDPVEFESDLNQARSSLADWSDFKKYRFNIWQSHSKSWLRMSDWGQCDRTAYDVKKAAAGLDLSSTTDMTAFSIVSQCADETLKIRNHYWLPEERLEDYDRLGLPIEEWANGGWVTLIPGGEIIHSEVQLHVYDTCKHEGVSIVGYDNWNALATQQELERRGLTMVAVPQTYSGLSFAAKTFEAAVSGHRIDNGGDPVLRWMIGNVQVISDPNGNIRPVKPKDNKREKKIDGIAAMLNALHCLDRVPEKPKPTARVYAI